jgi:hypothetical protein
MAMSNAICRIGVFHDGIFFLYAQRYFYCFINDRLLSVVNYAADINALENDKEYKQAFKSLFWKGADS